MKYRPGRRCGFLVLFMLVFSVLLWGCASEEGSAEEKTPASWRVRPVKVYELEKQAGRKIRTFPATAKAVQDTDLSFRVAGPLETLNAETGQFMEENTLIARIDQRDFRVRINNLKAELAASRADYNEAKLQFDRYRKLVSENAAAKSTFDQVKAAYERAEARVESTRQSLEEAENALSDTTLYAPFTGYIDRQYVENHEMVQAGQPIVSMVDLSVMEMELALPEDLVTAVDRFVSYECRFTAIDGRTFPARFKEIGKQKNPSNQTYPLTLVVEQTDDMPIRPGMTAEVDITIKNRAGKGAFIVPVSALANDHKREPFVWVIDAAAGRVKRRPVRVGALRSNGFIEISGDLKAGQLIASAGVHTLTADQKVRLMKPDSKTNIGEEM